MVDPLMLLAFVPAGLALNFTPGADMMFCLGQGLRSGPQAAIAASGGIAMGAFIHAGLAGLGLGALIATVPIAFEVIRWVGVAYLIWLAVQTLRQSGQATCKKPAPCLSGRPDCELIQPQGNLVCAGVCASIRCARGRIGIGPVSDFWRSVESWRFYHQRRRRRFCQRCGAAVGAGQPRS